MRELEVLYEALHSDFGIEIEITGSIQVVMNKLYNIRREHPELEAIQISRSPENPEKCLWLLKRNPGQPQDLKPNPQGDGELHSLADLLGDD